MRRILIGTVAGVVLALATAVGVSAYWQAQQRLDLRTTASGDLRITAAWRDGTPAWAPLYPGSSASAVIRVTSQSAGTTLRWRLKASGDVAAAYRGQVSFAAWQGACGTGTPITSDGLPGLAPNAVVDLCVQFTLSATAPETLQGAALTPSVTMNAEQMS
ncbi:hypothetical protein [Microbacterium sp.]|uniref:hypothetical protein n=1 Tax=Microbacterium sp. TaxID=51671 RepID=UPI0033413CD9